MIRNSFTLLIVLVNLLGFSQQPIHPKSEQKPVYEFIQNQGQWHPLALYKTEIPYGNLYLESAGMVYDLIHPEDYNRIQQQKHEHHAVQNFEIPRRHAVRMRFAGVEYAPRTEMRNIQSHYYNYYTDADEDKWASELHPAGEVGYINIYEGVDFEISGVKDIKYQWVLTDPTPSKINQIQTTIEGADAISIHNGQLLIETSVGTLTDDEPFVYQEINGEIIELNSRYVLRDSTLSYEILSEINPNYPLVIDPKLIFSTYSGSKGDNFGFTATYDSRGNLYAGGIVDSRGPYPVKAGAYDDSYNGGGGSAPANLRCDVSISKYDSAGTQLLWATYLGGKDDEYPHSLVVDRNDDLLILGTTYSDNFPYSKGCFDSTHAGQTDIYVSKLSEDGTTLLGSTFIGGNLRDGLTLNNISEYKSGDLKYNYSDDFRGDILTDDDGHIFVATTTRSKGMPVVNETQSNNKGQLDGYIFELSPDCSKLLWATYLGGSAQDAFYSIKLDKYNHICVGGGTASSDLPTADTVHSPTLNGDIDGMIAIFDKTTKQLQNITYWGTEKYDQIYFLDTDVQGRIYATGQTTGNITKSSGAYGESGKGQFIFRIDSLLKNIDLQTTFGNAKGKPNLTPSAFLVDVCEHIYFSGWGSDVFAAFHSGNTTDMPISADAEQSTTDDNDFYIIVLDKNASGLLYATYFGGNVTDDHVDGGTSRFDKKGVIYQSVCSSCPPSADSQTTRVSDFPTSSGAPFESNPSIRCSNASFKIDLQIKSAVIADFIATPTVGCGPLDVQFDNRSILGDSLYWDFGDGTTSNQINPKHLYSEPGLYVVTLTVVDSNSCNISSVYQRQILVLTQSDADFDVEFSGCENKLRIINNTTDGFDYLWSFGDGDSTVIAHPKHKYKTTGDYHITLYVNKGTMCESQVTKTVTILDKMAPEVKLYNVFTPNDDGHNDCFKMEGKFLQCTEYTLKIFNRWGEKVFETTDPEDCWDGTLSNSEIGLPESTYYYLLWLDDSKHSSPISGIVELIR